MSTEQVTGNRFMVHDVVVGILAGAGVGSIVGLFLAVRVSDSNFLTGLGALVGAVLFVYLLTRSHRDGGFLNGIVVASWILLVLAAAFIALLASAIANFQ